jgi:hypothetical protein
MPQYAPFSPIFRNFLIFPHFGGMGGDSISPNVPLFLIAWIFWLIAAGTSPKFPNRQERRMGI